MLLDSDTTSCCHLYCVYQDTIYSARATDSPTAAERIQYQFHWLYASRCLSAVFTPSHAYYILGFPPLLSHRTCDSRGSPTHNPTLSPSFSLATQGTTIVESSGGIPSYKPVLDSSDPEGGVMSTMLTSDDRTSPVVWAVDVHLGQSVAIELRETSGLSTKTYPIPVQLQKAKVEADHDGALINDTSTSSIYARVLAMRERGGHKTSALE
ncbi:hypothetical protein PM082_014239 [Marasmius tenuissimus]|nr:hypothetical protein PM082_014239 [Marasmius tenuissimus]